MKECVSLIVDNRMQQPILLARNEPKRVFESRRNAHFVHPEVEMHSDHDNTVPVFFGFATSGTQMFISAVQHNTR